MRSADGASFYFTGLVFDIATELILLDMSLHEPISVQANQMEPVEADTDPHEITSLQKAVVLLLAQLVEADVAAALNWVVIAWEDIF